MAKILVVEDDHMVANTLKDRLELDQHKVEVAHNGRDALELATNFHYDLLILDLGLPEMEGMEVLERYRSRGKTAPVLILSGRHQTQSKERGLDLGADDYLTKPFDLREMSARVRALLRRSTQQTSDILACGHLKLDLQRKELHVEEEIVKLMPTEYGLLEFLMRNKGRLFSAGDLLNSCWNSDTEATENAVRTYITRLRKKIDLPGRQTLLQSVYGMGYKLEDTEPGG